MKTYTRYLVVKVEFAHNGLEESTQEIAQTIANEAEYSVEFDEYIEAGGMEVSAVVTRASIVGVMENPPAGI